MANNWNLQKGCGLHFLLKFPDTNMFQLKVFLFWELVFRSDYLGSVILNNPICMSQSQGIQVNSYIDSILRFHTQTYNLWSSSLLLNEDRRKAVQKIHFLHTCFMLVNVIMNMNSIDYAVQITEMVLLIDLKLFFDLSQDGIVAGIAHHLFSWL